MPSRWENFSFFIPALRSSNKNSTRALRRKPTRRTADVQDDTSGPGLRASAIALFSEAYARGLSPSRALDVTNDFLIQHGERILTNEECQLRLSVPFPIPAGMTSAGLPNGFIWPGDFASSPRAQHRRTSQKFGVRNKIVKQMADCILFQLSQQREILAQGEQQLQDTVAKGYVELAAAAGRGVFEPTKAIPVTGGSKGMRKCDGADKTIDYGATVNENDIESDED